MSLPKGTLRRRAGKFLRQQKTAAAQCPSQRHPGRQTPPPRMLSAGSTNANHASRHRRGHGGAHAMTRHKQNHQDHPRCAQHCIPLTPEQTAARRATHRALTAQPPMADSTPAPRSNQRGTTLQANAKLPRVQLHAVARLRPVPVRPFREGGVIVEPDRSVLLADDKPGLLRVVLGDREAVLAHEHMFASGSSAKPGLWATTEYGCVAGADS